MKLCLTVLMGLPGSGKTSFARTLKKDFKSYDGKNFNFIHVCYDDLLPCINYKELQDGDTKWKDMRTDILNQIDLLISSLVNNCYELCPIHFIRQIDLCPPDSVIVVVVDDNMYLRSMRYALFRKAKQYNISFCQVYLHCTPEESNERNMLRASEEVIPFCVISQMNEKIEAPRSTNKWERHSLIVDANDINHKVYVDYFSMLNIALNKPECTEPENDLGDKERDVLICMTNVIHQCDIAIRQIISRRIQQYKLRNGSGNGLKDYSSELSLQKGKLLSEIRSGAIQVPDNALNEISEDNSPEKNNLKQFLEEVF